MGKSNPTTNGYIAAFSSYLFMNSLHIAVSADKDGTEFSLSLPETFLFQPARFC